MSDLSKPLFTLTIGQYKKLQQEILEEQVLPTLRCKQKSDYPVEQDIIFTEEVCQLTGYTKPTLYSKVSRYEIPILSRGKPLTFSKKDILQWIKDGKPPVIQPIPNENL